MFASLVVHAIFVGVGGEEIETHVFGLLTGKEERLRRTRRWFWHFNLASKRGPMVA